MVRCDQRMPENEADATQTAGRPALTQRLRFLSPLRFTAHVAKNPARPLTPLWFADSAREILRQIAHFFRA
jgi:hypothetical protein